MLSGLSEFARLGDYDVIIIGAGAAGLAAFRDLDRAGLRTVCLEARDRIGGRILTVHDPACPIPIELGAEFIHGRSPETWEIVRSAGLKAYDAGGQSPAIEGMIDRSSFWKETDQIFDEMERTAETDVDQSFANFLSKIDGSDAAKEMATAYVEGFNAARKEVIGIASLAIDQKAADAIDGDKGFRIVDGYDSVAKHLLAGVDDVNSKLRLNTVVQSVEWFRGRVAVETSAGMFHGKRTILTLPLGVLQARSVLFDPPPVDVLAAADALAFGDVKRLVLRFREAFWERDEALRDAGFLFSQQKHFPVWWTAMPIRVPILVGWSSGPRCAGLKGQSKDEIVQIAIDELSKIIKTGASELRELLEASYMHDWHADPFAGGAYSYVPTGALAARRTLAEPVEDTLYFAGEATELDGHSATVHGAIASGRRAANEIIKRN